MGRRHSRPSAHWYDVEVRPTAYPVPCPYHLLPRWLKQSGLDRDALSHLKRVRKQGSISTLLLDTSPDPPALPPEPPLASPYQVPVPCHPALTPTSLSLKNTFWPTVFAPKRKYEPEPFTQAKVRWASDAVRRLKEAYAKIPQNGEVSRIHTHTCSPTSRSTSLPPAAHRRTRPDTLSRRQTALAPVFRARYAYIHQTPPSSCRTRRHSPSSGLSCPTTTTTTSDRDDTGPSGQEWRAVPPDGIDPFHHTRTLPHVYHGTAPFPRQGGLLSRPHAKNRGLRWYSMHSLPQGRQPQV